MPVQLGHDTDGCFARWGKHGAKYHYTCGNESARELAKQKAYIQGIAIGEYAVERVSFDFDGTLTRRTIQDIAKQLVESGVEVYIISARNRRRPMFDIANKVGISLDNVYATGSNTAKVEKIKELNITMHYDDNIDVINELNQLNIKSKHV